MFKRSVITITLIGVLSLLFTGCGASLSTHVQPVFEKPNQRNIFVSQDTTLSFLGATKVKQTNFKYAFAAAAYEANKKGFKMFSIVFPYEVKDVYIRHNVKSFKDAYSVCVDSDDGFSAGIVGSMGGSACDSFVVFSSGSAAASSKTFPIRMEVEFHNTERKDNITFNVEDILNSSLLNDLDSDNFVPAS